MTAAQALSLAALPALLFAALQDIASRRVPNWASALIALCGLAARLASGDILPSLLLALAVFTALFLMWQRGWIGGGDVKLLAACALLVPAPAVLDLVLATSMAGGVLATAYLLGRRLPPLRRTLRTSRNLIRRIGRIEAWRMRRNAPLPYACAIAAGCVFTLITG